MLPSCPCSSPGLRSSGPKSANAEGKGAKRSQSQSHKEGCPLATLAAGAVGQGGRVRSAAHCAVPAGQRPPSAAAAARAGSRKFSPPPIGTLRAGARQKGTCAGRAAEAAEAKDEPRSCTAAELTPKASALPNAHAAATNASTADFAIFEHSRPTIGIRVGKP